MRLSYISLHRKCLKAGCNHYRPDSHTTNMSKNKVFPKNQVFYIIPAFIATVYENHTISIPTLKKQGGRFHGYIYIIFRHLGACERCWGMYCEQCLGRDESCSDWSGCQWQVPKALLLFRACSVSWNEACVRSNIQKDL